MGQNVLIMAGDGIGPEIMAEAEKVLACLTRDYGLDIDLDHALVGGAAYDDCGTPLPEETLQKALVCDAILFGAVGGPKWDGLPRELRPERGALLPLRSELALFANLRPALTYPQLVAASSLKPELVSGLDIMIVRELTGGIYFAQPRGISTAESGERVGINTLRYTETEIRRIAHAAFRVAMQRDKRLCSVDKENVLEATVLWREVVVEVAAGYPEVELQHLLVDNAAMQLVRMPKQFDVIVTTNMFGDILSDLASMLSGSIGMLPSASLDENGKGLYEPIHGSAPDITGRGLANPLAMILSAAMMLRYSLGLPEQADRVENAVKSVLSQGLRTADIHTRGTEKVSTAQMGDAVVRALLAGDKPEPGTDFKSAPKM